MDFSQILDKYRTESFSERDKGNKFELLMLRYLKTDPTYAGTLENVWLWNDFFAKDQFGGKDVGIDLVAETSGGDFWAIQCKCYKADTKIDKPAVDTFLSTSGKTFQDREGKKVRFAFRLWLDTTEKGFNQEALNSLENQDPEFHRVGLLELENAKVDWEKLDKGAVGEKAQQKKKSPRDHQKEAIQKVHEYFQEAAHDRGKLIMACGTGKTYTALCIAENETQSRGTILFLVPSIALLGQTLREWTADASVPIHPICICSDSSVSKAVRKNDEEGDGYSVTDLALPASTDVRSIVKQLEYARQQAAGKGGMTVVFSTYQSIEVISKAQKQIKDFEFDLIVCDEAHRTTGVTLAGKDESNFVKVHDDKFLQAKKRIYMTATPRLYSESSKKKAEENSIEICSMDDVSKYGEEMYRIGFGEAVEKQLLSDYKVLVLTIDPMAMSESLQQSLATDSGEMLSDDEAKLVGCFNALSKITLVDDHQLKETDPLPMKRAVAFSQNIKVSKEIVDLINRMKESYYEKLKPEAQKETVRVSAMHIDGGMGSSAREERLAWLKGTTEEGECRILNNVRCLSEGVDVPSLDAVLFLSARDSEVDVVQSVGRVMRTAPGKKYGYIIIPVLVPSGEKAEKVLDNNDRFKVVWKILNALRAHDDRFNAMVNKIQFCTAKPGQGLTGGRIGVSNGQNPGGVEHVDPKASQKQKELQEQMELKFQELQGAIYAKMVEKVGSRRYWEDWAKDVADIAMRHEERIRKLIATEGKPKREFERFLKALKKNLNPGVDAEQAIEMLSQHLITKPVFEALFENYDFSQNNPVSKALQRIIDLVEDASDDVDKRSLEKFYQSVKLRAEGVESAEGKQKIIIELYDKFFKSALPKTVEKLGIVYTPVECVDFIIRSVNDVLQREFGRKLTDENVNIIDPFTGTGTFITRLIQSGLIAKKDLPRKFERELKANEIVLLAYYIASVNIENAYHDAMAAEEYTPFKGICLTDSFQLSEHAEQEDFGEDVFPVNGPRAREQKKVPIQVVIGNPPYSVGQKSANDNAQNQKYPDLDSRIDRHYVQTSEANLNKAAYDSYIKAFRWATDRIDKKSGGVIGFITNGSWIDSNGLDGFRKSLEKEFSKIYVFNLRGNQRTSGELSRKEGGKIFGSGSRTPVAITILVKKPAAETSRSGTGTATPGSVPETVIARSVATKQSFQASRLPRFARNDVWTDARNDEEDDVRKDVNASAGTATPGSVPETVIARSVATKQSESGQDCFTPSGFAMTNAVSGFGEMGATSGFGEMGATSGLGVTGAENATPRSGSRVPSLRRAAGDEAIQKAVIKYFDIGDYLSREEKLKRIREAESITHLEMTTLKPNEHGDWINLRNENFGKWTPIEPEKKFDAKSKSWFVNYSLGVATNKDCWLYNSSQERLNNNLLTMVTFYNEQRVLFHNNKTSKSPKDVVKYDPKQITWTDVFLTYLKNNIELECHSEKNTISMYRPFFKQNFCYEKKFIQRTYQQLTIFPTPEQKNLVICVSGIGVTKEFSCIITDTLPDLELIGKSQCFPLYYYETLDESSLFAQSEKFTRKDAVSDYILKKARSQYADPKIKKEDIFYYVYGFLHSPEYREAFSADLKKMLPRIPLVDTAKDFWAFSSAGKKLAQLHLNYETAEPYNAMVVSSSAAAESLPLFQSKVADVRTSYSAEPPETLYQVRQMRFPKIDGKDRNGKAKKVDDKTRIVYNEKLTIASIPLEAYEYVVNGKSAIEWLMERYAVTTDKASGIVNDPNDWALEHGDPAYIFNLLLRIITVSVETVKIVKALPKVEF